MHKASDAVGAWVKLVTLLAELAARRVQGAQDGAAETEAYAAAAGLSQQLRGAGGSPSSGFADRLALTVAEELAVWCLVARQLEPRIDSRLEAMFGGRETSFAGLVAIAYAGDTGAALADLGANGRLFRFGLIERVDEPGSSEPSWSSRTVRATDRALALALGTTCESVVSAAIIERPTAAVAELAIRAEAVQAAAAAVRAGAAIVVASGLPGAGRRTLLTAVAGAAGFDVLSIDARKLARDPAILKRQLRAIALECTLAARTPLLANLDALVDDKDGRGAIGRLELVECELAPLIDGLILATCAGDRPAIRWDRPVIEVEVGQPTSTQRATLWHAKLGQGTWADAEYLANQYPLAPALIHHAAAAVNARVAGRPLEPDDVRAGIRSVIDDRLGLLAKRVTVTQTWDDLVLSPDQMDPVIELMARVRERGVVYEQWGFGAKVGKGLGIAALFSGPPGTGKTMVAALIASELALDLYQVDVSKVVSKWIGETEKNLAALFDAAEASHAILLFDEADALFGKRTDVKSSNDRHANLETNYLLQRLESFTGICFLTSNHASHLDRAFQRRLSLHLRFELPDQAERAQLWGAMMPKAAPVTPRLDLGNLARRFVMSGGHIRNAALRAAFLAADEGTAITHQHLERAAIVEYEGLGKLAA